MMLSPMLFYSMKLSGIKKSQPVQFDKTLILIILPHYLLQYFHKTYFIVANPDVERIEYKAPLGWYYLNPYNK